MSIAIRTLENRKFPCVYVAACHFKVSHVTLGRGMNGGKSVAESCETQQLLSIAEQSALAEWIRQMTAVGHPPTHSLIGDVAEELRKHRTVGINDYGGQLVVYERIGHFVTHRYCGKSGQFVCDSGLIK